MTTDHTGQTEQPRSDYDIIVSYDYEGVTEDNLFELAGAIERTGMHRSVGWAGRVLQLAYENGFEGEHSN